MTIFTKRRGNSLSFFGKIMTGKRKTVKGAKEQTRFGVCVEKCQTKILKAGEIKMASDFILQNRSDLISKDINNKKSNRESNLK